jgi:hypothetical protein
MAPLRSPLPGGGPKDRNPSAAGEAKAIGEALSVGTANWMICAMVHA